MSVVLVTGSGGLIGSEAATYFASQGYQIVGIDNDMRQMFFGAEASTQGNQDALALLLGARYIHHAVDIRDTAAVDNIFSTYKHNIVLVIHTAAQPSHDWAARAPMTDFEVNVTGTLQLLEATRMHAPDAVFIFTSTNKVYGDRPNALPLIELPTRWEIAPTHPYAEAGIPESMSVDETFHSLFGASKLAADQFVQEYGRYFGMRTACFRCGCLTGPRHAGTKLHGFLSYLMKCTATGTSYTVYGYGGKQVRDNIHSADLISAFHEFFLSPREGAVYNMGGGRQSNCSMLEAIAHCEAITGCTLRYDYSEQSRRGDHIWWISDYGRFARDYPNWSPRYTLTDILQEMYDTNVARWEEEVSDA